SGPDGNGPDGDSPDAPDSDPDLPDAAGAMAETATGGGDAGANGDGGGDDDGPGAGDGRAVVRGKGLRLLTGLGTIAGVDRRASQLLGWGTVHAELARTVSSTSHASWWYVLVQPDGTPLDVGPIRRRPTQRWATGPTPNYRDVEVWLQVTRDEL